jgi:hypothetical protein
MTNQKTFSVPPEVGVAQITGRSELLALLRQRINAGDTLPPDQVEGLIGLLEQSVSDWAEVTRLQGFLGAVANLINDTSKGLVRRADQLRELSHNIHAIDDVRGAGEGGRE